MKLTINNFSLSLSSLLSVLVFCSLMELLQSQGQIRQPLKQSRIEEFIQKYNKKNAILKDNLKKDQISLLSPIKTDNSNIKSFYSDFHEENFSQKFQSFKNDQQTQISQNQGFYQQWSLKTRVLLASIPTSFDWRNVSAVTEVKDQGYCGAGYAFAAAAFFQQDSILSGLANSSINLSEMYLITCNPENTGCKSGNVQSSFDTIIDKGSFPQETLYPFNPSKSYPANICLKTDFFKISNFTRRSYYNVRDPSIIKEIIYKKPAVTSICGVDLAFYSPSSSINSSRTLKCNPSNKLIDHSVLLIGYTETQWIIKNSWGKNWGLDGYAYITRNPAQDCCIGDQLITTGELTLSCSVQYCQKCVQTDSCYRCQSGKYVFHNSTTGIQTCELCTESNCKECYNYFGTCKWCADGFALNSTTGKCVTTSFTGCNKLDAGLCAQCKPGYKLTDKKTSCNVSCTIRNCINCTNKICTECAPGFNLTTGVVNGKNIQVCSLYSCTKANCTLCNSTGACIQCKSGFLLNSTAGTCYTNCTAIAGCINCTAGINTCNECVEGKSYNSSGKACQVFTGTTNCRIHGKTACTACKSGYTLSAAKTCIQNCQVSVCSTCMIADIYTCLSCENGYYLFSTPYYAYCDKNPCEITDCSLCGSNGTCLKCATKFLVYNASSNKCQNQCKLQNCRDCLPTATKCSRCHLGYSLDFYTDLCRESNISNCLMIDDFYDYWSCTQCNKNYYMSNDYMKCYIYCTDYYCEQCQEQSLHECTKCFDGYYPYFVNGTRTCQLIHSTMKGCDHISYNQSYCYDCNYFYLQDQTTGTCTPNTKGCPNQCEYCTPPEYLFECKCKNGLAFEYYSQKCINPPLADTNCYIVKLKSGKYYCKQCLNGMLVNAASTGCEPPCIVNNCSLCETGFNKYCVTCDVGYFIDAGGTKCTQCPVVDCAVCISPTCLACKSGYQLSSNGQSCTRINCLQGYLFDGYGCICPLGTFYTAFTCQACFQNYCRQCSQIHCFSCESGYYLHNNYCQACQTNCKTCISATFCTVCKDGYIYETLSALCVNIAEQGGRLYYLTNTTVVQCSGYCTSCTSQGICLQCTIGYAVVNGTCLPCQAYCKTCNPSNLTSCLTCQYGFNLINGSCLKCNDTYCITCDFTTNLCTKCTDGFHLYGGTCKTCVEQNCVRCNYIGQCTKCASGYTLMSDFTCQQCGGNCRQCNPNSINQCYTACNLTSYLQNNQCYQCPLQCKTCISAQVCTKCSQGYVLRNSTCTKICQQGCYECNQTMTQICLRCISGYTLTNNFNCSLKIDCNADNSCTICPINFALINGTCQPCNTSGNCTQCSSSDLSLCVQCKNGFYLSNGKCMQCNETCLTCIQADRCQLCKDGFYLPSELVFGTCSRCDPMCKTCVQNSKKCVTCRQGYELSVTDKCLRVEKIQCQLRLDLVIENFPSLSRQIRDVLVSLLGLVDDYRYYIITGLEQGSTILSYSLSVPDGVDPYVVYNDYQLSLIGLDQLAGVNVISIDSVILVDSYAFIVENTTDTNTTTNTTTIDTNNNTTIDNNNQNTTNNTNNQNQTESNTTDTNNNDNNTTNTTDNTTNNNTNTQLTDPETNSNNTNNNSNNYNNSNSNQNNNNNTFIDPNLNNNNNTSTNNTNNQNDTLNSYALPLQQSSSPSKLPIIIGIIVPIIIIILGTLAYYFRKKLFKRHLIQNESELALQEDKPNQTQPIQIKSKSKSKSKIKPAIPFPDKGLNDSITSLTPMKANNYKINKSLSETKDLIQPPRQPDYYNNRQNNTTFFNSTGYPQQSTQSKLQDPNMISKLELTTSFDTTLQNIVNQLNQGGKNIQNKIGLHEIIDEFDEDISEIHSKANMKQILNLINQDEQQMEEIQLAADKNTKRSLGQEEENLQSSTTKLSNYDKTFYGFKPNFNINNNNIVNNNQINDEQQNLKEEKQSEISIAEISKNQQEALVQQTPSCCSTPQPVSNLHVIEQAPQSYQNLVPEMAQQDDQLAVNNIPQIPQVPKPSPINSHLQIIEYEQDEDEIQQSQF